jgi:hypothetical protein
MQQLIEARLREHRAQLASLQQCVDRQMSMEIRKRNGILPRFLHVRMQMHSMVIEELELLLKQVRAE